MTPERYQQIQKLFESALEREPTQRATFLQEVCDGDPPLRSQLEALLASHEEASSFLESPTLKVATLLLTDDNTEFMVGQIIGPYEVLREIGRGGMGEVYLAQDKRLGRQVALKFLPVSFQDDPDRRARLLTEARAASSLHSPHIATIHDIGEREGRAYIVMEYVEGEPLSDKLKGGPLAISEAIDIGVQVAEALEEAHEEGITHRDIKSSNLMVTPRDQVKVLDFGLAKVSQRLGADTVNEESKLTVQQETAPGMVMGTVHYMSPEQARGLEVDGRSDLFSLGVVLYEMVAGRLPFEGETSSDVLVAILGREPQPLARHRPEVPAELEQIVSRCLEKDRDRRYQSARDLLIDLRNLKQDTDLVASQLRAPLVASQMKAAARGRVPTRLIVLPFYQLRPDEETAFLCFSLPDAISSSLAGLHSLVVRSSRVAARFAGPSIDLRSIAAETEVDVVMTGTVLRAADQLRVSTQLLEAPASTVLWSYSALVHLDDIFRLQDELVQRILESLALPLTEPERSFMRRDVPASALAYEFYLRANQLAGQIGDLALARDLYRRCLEVDPHYAPAWARLARCYRVLGKYGVNPSHNLARAEEAFRRAFALNPDLPAAHNLYTHHEIENGRAKEAIIRLLGRIQGNRNDPELYAGLVSACRYAGLLEASLTAHAFARRVDPNVSTSVSYTHFAIGNYQLAVGASTGDADSCRFEEVMALDAVGRCQEALERLRSPEDKDLFPVTRLSLKLLKAFLERDREQTVEFVREYNLANPDPESFFYGARFLARVGETVEALVTLQRAVRGGFYCVPALLKDSYLEPVRAAAGFKELMREAKMLSVQAQAAFVEAGGEHLLAATASLQSPAK